MRVTKRTNIAIRILMFCAVNPDRLVTKSDIAGPCNSSENHLAQVINRLAQHGFLYTQRGRNGGLRLARPPEQINIGDVFREFESEVPLAECFADADNSCPLKDACRLRLATPPNGRFRGRCARRWSDNRGGNGYRAAQAARPTTRPATPSDPNRGAERLGT